MAAAAGIRDKPPLGQPFGEHARPLRCACTMHVVPQPGLAASQLGGAPKPSSVSAKQPTSASEVMPASSRSWCRAVPSLSTVPPNRLNWQQEEGGGHGEVGGCTARGLLSIRHTARRINAGSRAPSRSPGRPPTCTVILVAIDTSAKAATSCCSTAGGAWASHDWPAAAAALSHVPRRHRAARRAAW